MAGGDHRGRQRVAGVHERWRSGACSRVEKGQEGDRNAAILTVGLGAAIGDRRGVGGDRERTDGIGLGER